MAGSSFFSDVHLYTFSPFAVRVNIVSSATARVASSADSPMHRQSAYLSHGHLNLPDLNVLKYIQCRS